MRKFYFLMLCMMLANAASAQSFIQDGAIEGSTGCPDDTGQLNSIAFFSGAGSPSLMSRCATPGIAGIPLNQFGYQDDPTGDGYIALKVWDEQAPADRDLIWGQFDQPVMPDSYIVFSIDVSLADSSTMAAGNIYMRVSDHAFSDFSLSSGGYEVALSLVDIDTSKWVTKYQGLVSFADTANFWAIGNFSPGAPVIYDTIASGPGLEIIYINNLCMQYRDFDLDFEQQFCFHAFTVSATPAEPAASSFSVFPNPAVDILQIGGLSTFQHWSLVNPAGLLVAEGLGDRSVDVSTLAAGIYWLEAGRAAKLVVKN